MVARAGGEDLIANEALVKHPFNAAHELCAFSLGLLSLLPSSSCSSETPRRAVQRTVADENPFNAAPSCALFNHAVFRFLIVLPGSLQLQPCSCRSQLPDAMQA